MMDTSIRPDSTAPRQRRWVNSAPPDGCPNCITGRHYPWRSTFDNDDGVHGEYLCELCGHRWYCNWAVEYI